MYVIKLQNIYVTQDLLHTHRRCMVTLSVSSICTDKFWYRQPFFTDICFKHFHCKEQLFVHATFHFYIQLFCSMGKVHRWGIYWYCVSSTYKQCPFDCLKFTERRTGVVLLAGIQWMIIPYACKLFWKHTSKYLIVQYRIPRISVQGSYILVVSLLQKQLEFQVSGWSSWSIS